MKLSDLRKAPAEPVVEETAAASAEEPWGVARVVTPSGLDVYYQAGPKRMYLVDGIEVPSASTVLQVLEKGGLSWWGMKVGVKGALSVLTDGDLYPGVPYVDPPDADVEAVVERLKEHKLTVNHVKDKAADRGTNVHSALELYAETGTLPNPDNYPANEAGYVRGLVRFLEDAQPVVEHSELMVASSAGFAGRFDMVATLQGDIVTKTYPKRTDVRTHFGETRGLWDLKTSKGVYPSYHLQLAGYEGAMEECGYGTVEMTGVIRVTDDGRYELVPGRATFEDFLSVLETYRIIRRLEGKA